MSRVRPPPECIEHQHIESTKLDVSRLRNRLDIGDVGQAAEAVAEHPQMTVLKGERKDIDSGQSYWLAGLGGMQAEPGLRGSFVGTDRIIEDVVERCPHPLQRFWRSVDRQRPPLAHREDPQ